MVDAAVEVGVGGSRTRRRCRCAPGRGSTSAAGAGRVEFFVGVVADGDDQVVVVAQRSSRPARGGRGRAEPVAARDRRRGGGPRGRDGCRPTSPEGAQVFQVAAASWERAEFAVHTNTTRRRSRGPVGHGGERSRPDGRVVQCAAGRSCAAGRPRNGPAGSRRRPRAPGGGGRAGWCPARLRGQLAGRGVAGDEAVRQGEPDRFAERSEDAAPARSGDAIASNHR